MKCSGDSEILHEIVRDTSGISSCFSDFRVVSRTISCSITNYYVQHHELLCVVLRTIMCSITNYFVQYLSAHGCDALLLEDGLLLQVVDVRVQKPGGGGRGGAGHAHTRVPPSDLLLKNPQKSFGSWPEHHSAPLANGSRKTKPNILATNMKELNLSTLQCGGSE